MDNEAATQVDSFATIEKQLKCKILVLFCFLEDDSRFNILHTPQYPKKLAPLPFIGLNNSTYYPIRGLHDTERKVAHFLRTHEFHNNFEKHETMRERV